MITKMVALGAAFTLFAAAPKRTEGGLSPVLLELFTSEGCSSCPPADRLLEELDRGQPFPNVQLIVLSEHVDYWNHLGWKDRFSSRQYSARQEAYARRFGLDSVYTPQLVVDGALQVNGSDRRGVADAVTRSARRTKLPLSLDGATRDGSKVSVRVSVPVIPKDAGAVRLYLALAESRAQSQVMRGENAGRALAHVAVTRLLLDRGRVQPDGTPSQDIVLTVPQDTGSNGLRVIAFLQEEKTGRILGASLRAL